VTTQPAAKKLAESMRVGQRVLCWQRWSAPFEFPPPPGVRAAADGIVEFAGLNPQGRWLFFAKDQFSDPVPLLKWSKTNPIIGKIFSFPRRMGTLIELSSAERSAADLLKGTRAEDRMTPAEPPSDPDPKPPRAVVKRAALEAVRSRAARSPGQRANEAALRAMRAWLLGKCLAAEVDELRFGEEGGPVPAPGLPKLLDRLEHDVRDVCDLSDRVSILLRDPDQTEQLEARIKVEANAAEEGADESERVARRIAQLAFGVSSGLEGNERVQRLDRAAVSVLHPPPGTGTPVGLVDDGLELFSRHTPELRIELGGIICRMLVDRNVTVRFGQVELRVGPDETFHLSSPEGDQVWDSPVYVSEPARAIAKALKKAGMSLREIRDAGVAETG
jgi:hypothetical protein